MTQLSNTQKFKTVTTNLGRNAVALAHATGSSIKLTHMAVGDGSGQSIDPNSTMTSLVHEVYRGQINDIVISSDVEGEFTAELLIPQSVGGFFIREVGLFFADGTMFAIGNTPITEKTEITSGAATDLLVRMIIRVLDAGTIEIFIDPAQVLATREYADRKIYEHDTDKNAHNYLLQSLAAKLDKASLSDAINNPSSANAASSAAVNALRLAVADLAMPSLDYFEFTANSLGDDKYNTVFTAPANGYGFVHTRNIPANTSVPEISIGHVENRGSSYIQIGLGTSIMYRRAASSSADTLHFLQTFMPLMKGEEYSFYSQGFAEVHFGFFYLQGEI